MFRRIENKEVPQYKQGEVMIKATTQNKTLLVPLGDDIAKTHIAIFGGTQTGKTTLVQHFVGDLRKTHPQDKFIFLDVKRDFQQLKQKGDLVFSIFKQDQNYFEWSIMKEMANDPHPEQRLRAILDMLFQRAKEKSTQQFFPQSGEDLVYYYILSQYRQGRMMTNEEIKNELKEATVNDLVDFYQSDYAFVNDYIPLNNGNLTGQSAGVISEMRVVLDPIFNQETINYPNSISDFLNGNHNGLFLEFDARYKELSGNLIRTMLKILIQDQISIDHHYQGNVYLVLDEASVLNGDFDLADAVNIGAAQGLRVILSLQSTEMLYKIVEKNSSEHDIYSILAGFQSFIFFRPRDPKSMKFIQEIIGEDDIEYEIMEDRNKREIKKDYLVQSSTLSNLGLGDAIVKIKEYPFVKVHFEY